MTDRLRMAVAALLVDHTAVDIALAAVDLGVEESIAIARVCGEWNEEWSVEEFREARIDALCEDVKCGTGIVFDRDGARAVA